MTLDFRDRQRLECKTVGTVRVEHEYKYRVAVASENRSSTLLVYAGLF